MKLGDAKFVSLHSSNIFDKLLITQIYNLIKIDFLSNQ
jgi:hypothetical protein